MTAMKETRWFVNEDGEVYEYDLIAQPTEFPNDFHSPYRTKQQAEVAAKDIRDEVEALNDDADKGR